MASSGELLLNINDEQFNILTQYGVLSTNLDRILTERKTFYQNKIDALKKLVDENKTFLKNDNLASATVYKINDYISNLNDQINIYQANFDKLAEVTIKDVNETHLNFLEYVYKPFVSVGIEYVSTQFINNIQFGNSLKLPIPIIGDFVTQPTLAITLSEFSANDPKNKVKYCKFLGHRLLSQIDFINEGVVKDTLTTEDFNAYYHAELSKRDKKMWKTNIGQEYKIKCHFNSDPQNNEYREIRYLCFGPQTPKQTQEEITIYIPLFFWWFQEAKALPCNVLVKGMSLFALSLATQEMIVGMLDYAGNNKPFEPPKIKGITLYTKHLFVSDDILDLFAKKEVKTMVNLHQTLEFNLSSPQGNITLNSIQNPIHHIYIVGRPIENETGIDQLNTWNYNSFVTRKNMMIPVVFRSVVGTSFGINNLNFYTESDVFSSLSLTTKGNELFAGDISFFKNCMSMLNKSQNNKHLIINFSNDLYNITGFLNPKQLPELSLNYTSKKINVNNPVKIYILVNTISVGSFQNKRIDFLS